MSAQTVEKKNKKLGLARGSKQEVLKFPSFPQVDLLPSGIVEGRALKRVKVTAGLVVASSFVVVGLLYGAAHLEAGAADKALDTARSRTAELMAEQARYAEVNVVRAERATFLSAEKQGMSTEVAWSDYVEAIAATAPEGVTIVGLEASVSSVLGRAALTADPLQGDPLGSVTFAGTSPTVPDVAQWVRDLDGLHGLDGARIKVVERAATEGNEVLFDVQGSVVLTEDAASKRLPKMGE